MNERIEELAEQAAAFANADEYAGIERRIWQNVFRNKFAQLMIQETIKELCQQMYWHGIDLSNYPKFYIAIEKTEKQFGVEQ